MYITTMYMCTVYKSVCVVCITIALYNAIRAVALYSSVNAMLAVLYSNASTTIYYICYKNAEGNCQHQ
jgi:hypothetical protein